MRLQTYLAHAGIASRRSADDLISAGRVRVNGTVITAKGSPVDPSKDTVEVDGRLAAIERIEWFLVHKPRGVVSTVKDEHAPWAIVDLLPRNAGRLYPVGRLDKDTTGLILMTNDGDLAYRLTHPRFGVKKTYHALVAGTVTKEELEKIARGIVLDDGPTAPCRVRVISSKSDTCVCEIEIHEGKKRQVRRIFAAIGHRVIELARVSFAGIGLGDLAPGEYRRLSRAEVDTLRASLTKERGEPRHAPQ